MRCWVSSQGARAQRRRLMPTRRLAAQRAPMPPPPIRIKVRRLPVARKTRPGLRPSRHGGTCSSISSIRSRAPQRPPCNPPPTRRESSPPLPLPKRPQNRRHASARANRQRNPPNPNPDRIRSFSHMLNIVILAAGMGTRMRSKLPKVLHPIGGLPMLAHVMASARALSPNRIVIVTGHGAEQVQATCAGQDDVRFALQQPQLGTGHAVQQAVPELLPDGTTLILYGDVPLVGEATLRRLVDASCAGMSVLTVELDDPTGYGRIVRDSRAKVSRIVEQKDATPEELAIREVNTGMIAAPTRQLTGWLERLSNNNAQGEYYLTDVIGFAVQDGVAIATSAPDAVWETLGVNSRKQQAELERI